MLAELRIENLAVIKAAEMSFSPGLNIITGETGAGKTILAGAISLLLGSRADSGLIRPGAARAEVEAIFHVPEGFFSDLAGEIDITEEEELIVRRRISGDGRSRAFLGGRATTLGVLGQVTGRLLAFSAQHEQRRLMMASRQLDILDDYAGRELLDLTDEYGVLYERRAGLRAQLEELQEGGESRGREMELLKFQLDEIEAAGLSPGEDEALESERARLVRAEELKEATASLSSLLGLTGSGGGLMDSLAAAMEELKQAEGIDPALDDISSRLKSGYYELEEIGRAARDHCESISGDPERLREVDERLDLIGLLKRKFGGTVEEVIAYADAARGRLAGYGEDSEAVPRLLREVEDVENEMMELALDIRKKRLKAACGLQDDAASHLKDLAFNECGFEARIMPEEGSELLGPQHLKPHGSEHVEFYVSLNPGMPAAPIRETASGGELSRIMLAVKSSVADAGESATLVFDEIDAGIGGETGGAVGAKLKTIASGSQVICITHLPQIACHGDTHFSVVKESGREMTATSITHLRGEQLTDELCRMMGSKPDDKNARAHARSLLEKASGSHAGAAGGKRLG